MRRVGLQKPFHTAHPNERVEAHTGLLRTPMVRRPVTHCQEVDLTGYIESLRVQAPANERPVGTLAGSVSSVPTAQAGRRPDLN